MLRLFRVVDDMGILAYNIGDSGDLTDQSDFPGAIALVLLPKSEFKGTSDIPTDRA